MIFVTFTNVTTTIKIPLRKLRIMDNRLDIFSSHTLFDEALLEKNIYTPLPFYKDTLVWGFRIIRTADKKGIRKLACIKINDKRPFNHLELALKLENRQGNYSWQEKAKIFEYMQNYGFLPEAFHFTQYIETNSDSSWIKKAEIYRSLSEILREMIEKGHIDFKTASLVKGMDDRIFRSLENSGHLSFTEKRLFLTYLSEVVKRDSLNNNKSTALAKNLLSSPNPLAKLKELRYPKLSHMEKKYNTLYGKYITQEGIKMAHPPYFEGDSFSITFSFNSTENLEKKIKKIQLLQDHIDEFFSLLR